MNTAHIVHVHGLIVGSEFALNIDRHDGNLLPQISILNGERRAVGSDVPSGRLMARYVSGGRNAYSMAQDDEGYLLRFHGTCEFRFSADLRVITCHLAPESPNAYAPLFASGTVLSVALMLLGHPVLHASAVERDGVSLALLGRSGQGKSTLATMLCAAGGRLVTDDVLRVDWVDELAHCRLGVTEIRLREGSRSLADDAQPDPAKHRRTEDARIALSLPASDADCSRLASILIPLPSHDAARVSVEWLPPAKAMAAVLQFPRVVGWSDPVTNRRHFEHVARLARGVPVGVVTVPWGPPFPPGLADDIFEVGLAQPAPSGQRR